jgi:predicted permease
VALDVELPEFLFTAVKDIGAAATPLQLFLLGAFFSFSGMSEYLKALLTVVIGRLILIPGAVLLLAVKLGFLGTEFAALIGCFASSTAISSFTMTQQMGGDAKLAGYIVVITSALCPITIFCWAYLFRSLGIF